MRIQHNLNALHATGVLKKNTTQIAENIEKLSSGFRINKSADDAAGLGVSEKMRALVTASQQVDQNIQDGIALAQTADGAITEQQAMIQRLRDLAIQASNGTYDGIDRGAIQLEADQLVLQIDTIGKTTDFNGIPILDGTTFDTSPVYSGAGGAPYVKDLKDMTINDIKRFNSPTNFALKFDCSTCAHIKATFYFNPNSTATTVSPGAGDYTVEIGTQGVTTGAGLVAALKRGWEAAGGGKYNPATGVVTNGSKPTIAHFAIEDKGNGEMAFRYGSGSGGVAFEDRLFPNILKINTQIGATADDRMAIKLRAMTNEYIFAGDADKILYDPEEAALETLSIMDTALDYAANARGLLGASINRLEHAAQGNTVYQLNTTESESRIRDTDMAKEMMEFTKNNILSQSSQAMLAQANLQPQNILSLLK